MELFDHLIINMYHNFSGILLEFQIEINLCLSFIKINLLVYIIIFIAV